MQSIQRNPASTRGFSSSAVRPTVSRVAPFTSRRTHQLQQITRRAPVQCQGLFGLGLPEIAVIAGIAALVFGPSKLPELGKGLGKTVKSFQTAAKEFEVELKNATKDGEQPAVPAATEEAKKEVKEVKKDCLEKGSTGSHPSQEGPSTATMPAHSAEAMKETKPRPSGPSKQPPSHARAAWAAVAAAVLTTMLLHHHQ